MLVELQPVKLHSSSQSVQEATESGLRAPEDPSEPVRILPYMWTLTGPIQSFFMPVSNITGCVRLC